MEKKITIIGLGNQGCAWALNLQDSGHQVTIALREHSPSIKRAQELGFSTAAIEEAAKEGNTFALLIPDHQQLPFFQRYAGLFKQDCDFYYAHSYALECYQLHQHFPQFNHLLLAPKSIASELRFHYQSKKGSGAVYSLEAIAQEKRDSKRVQVLKLAQDLGITAGPYECGLREESDADLLSEQALLCGLIPYAGLEVYKHLRRKGTSKELAYFEAWHEIKLIANTLIELGPERFFALISPNALLGAQLGREKLVAEPFKKGLEQLWSDIENRKIEELLSHTSLDDLRRKMLEEWESEELTHTHRELRTQLYRNNNEEKA